MLGAVRDGRGVCGRVQRAALGQARAGAVRSRAVAGVAGRSARGGRGRVRGSRVEGRQSARYFWLTAAGTWTLARRRFTVSEGRMRRRRAAAAGQRQRVQQCSSAAECRVGWRSGPWQRPHWLAGTRGCDGRLLGRRGKPLHGGPACFGGSLSRVCFTWHGLAATGGARAPVARRWPHRSSARGSGLGGLAVGRCASSALRCHGLARRCVAAQQGARDVDGASWPPALHRTRFSRIRRRQGGLRNRMASQHLASRPCARRPGPIARRGAG